MMKVCVRGGEDLKEKVRELSEEGVRRRGGEEKEMMVRQGG